MAAAAATTAGATLPGAASCCTAACAAAGTAAARTVSTTRAAAIAVTGAAVTGAAFNTAFTTRAAPCTCLAFGPPTIAHVTSFKATAIAAPRAKGLITSSSDAATRCLLTRLGNACFHSPRRCAITATQADHSRGGSQHLQQRTDEWRCRSITHAQHHRIVNHSSHVGRGGALAPSPIHQPASRRSSPR